MSKSLKSVMLVDDNPHDNFFHELAVKDYNSDIKVLKFTSAESAFDYIVANKNNETQLPDMVFLDINMPGMNGWEFLDEYGKLPGIQKSAVMVVMLTTSEDPEDMDRAKNSGIVSNFKTKPLTVDGLKEIVSAHFL